MRRAWGVVVSFIRRAWDLMVGEKRRETRRLGDGYERDGVGWLGLRRSESAAGAVEGSERSGGLGMDQTLLWLKTWTVVWVLIEVDPVSWTPQDLCRRSPRCQPREGSEHHTRLSFGGRWLISCVLVARPRS